jgi:hypothetical protein
VGGDREANNPRLICGAACRLSGAANWPNRRPVQRAIRWDGLFPIELPGPGGLAELAEEVRPARAGSDAAFDLVVEVLPGAEPEIRAVVDAGP